jgi:hypothetical protein
MSLNIASWNTNLFLDRKPRQLIHLSSAVLIRLRFNKIQRDPCTCLQRTAISSEASQHFIGKILYHTGPCIIRPHEFQNSWYWPYGCTYFYDNVLSEGIIPVSSTNKRHFFHVDFFPKSSCCHCYIVPSPYLMIKKFICPSVLGDNFFVNKRLNSPCPSSKISRVSSWNLPQTGGSLSLSRFKGLEFFKNTSLVRSLST